jgi:nucleotide-binding universal stress UspA family protein
VHDNGKPFLVVGVSDSVASKAALRWADSEARRRGARLLVVRAWEPLQIAHYAPHAQHEDLAHERRAITAELASTLFATFGAKLPAFLFTEVLEGPPERVLADESAGADMLILGSTSAPTTIGRSVGPVIRSCLSRAHCPVVVIGPEDEAAVRRHQLAGRAADAAVPA